MRNTPLKGFIRKSPMRKLDDPSAGDQSYTIDDTDTGGEESGGGEEEEKDGVGKEIAGRAISAMGSAVEAGMSKRNVYGADTSMKGSFGRS